MALESNANRVPSSFPTIAPVGEPGHVSHGDVLSALTADGSVCGETTSLFSDRADACDDHMFWSLPACDDHIFRSLATHDSPEAGSETLAWIPSFFEDAAFASEATGYADRSSLDITEESDRERGLDDIEWPPALDCAHGNSQELEEMLAWPRTFGIDFCISSPEKLEAGSRASTRSPTRGAWSEPMMNDPGMETEEDTREDDHLRRLARGVKARTRRSRRASHPQVIAPHACFGRTQFQARARSKGQWHAAPRVKDGPKDKSFWCWVPECGRGFTRKDNLAAHCRTTHRRRGGRTRYVATLDESSEYYDPTFRGALTDDGLPIRGDDATWVE